MMKKIFIYNYIIGTCAKNSIRTLLFVVLILTASMTQAQVVIKGKVFGGARQADVGGSTSVYIGADKHDVIINAVYGGNDIAGTIGFSEDLPKVKYGDPNTFLMHADENGITSTVNKNTNQYNTFIRTSNETNDHHIFIGSVFGGGYGDYKYTSIEGNKYKVTDFKDDTKVIAASVDNLPVLNKAYLELCGGTFGYVYGGGDSVTVERATDISIHIESTSITTSIKDKILKDEIDNTKPKEWLTNAFLQDMGINTNYYHNTFHFSRVFGGNNKAPMAIRPTWHLERGKIENLYSGGNEGDMTSKVGLLLEIKPKPANSEFLVIDNVYGGSRKANVHPMDGTNEVPESEIQLTDKDPVTNKLKYRFPAGFSARVLVWGGNINNVYGGNDVTGNVTGGNAIGIYSSINGNVYGGGNGSYPYTDNKDLKDHPLYGDFYYDVRKIKGLASNADFTGFQSVEALNEFRPNAEQVSIRVWGQSETKKTIIGGGIYVGGNSATLSNNRTKYKVELKIGSNVIADKVFLGNNGENMVTNTILQQYAGYVNDAGTVSTTGDTGYKDYSQMVLTSTDQVNNKTQFDYYMDGCAMTLMPSVVFDDEEAGDPETYDVTKPSYFGSFYCGGNVGSMLFPGKITIDFDHPVVIFDKLVGGCNNAYVPGGATYDHPYNVEYQGGVKGVLDDPNNPDDDDNEDKLVLNLSGLRIEPKRWINENDKSLELEWNTVKMGDIYTAVASGTTLTVDETYYTSDQGAGEFVAEGNEVADGTNYFTKSVGNIETDQGSGTGNASAEDKQRRLLGGNIYGGCCESGVVNGNVIINVNSTIMDRDKLFDKVTGGDGSLYGDDLLTQQDYNIEERRTGVILGQQGMDVLGSALNLFGGGKGAATEIWGSTTINLNRGYVFQVFGGSEEGVIGKSTESATDAQSTSFQYLPEGKTSDSDKITRYLDYDSNYSCYVNLKGSVAGVPKSTGNFEGLPECEFIYGGGFMGPIAGNTVVRLGNGRIFNSFAGSCDADILGHTETYVGYRHDVEDELGNVTDQVDGFPWIRDYVYGGNDLGGDIKSSADFSGRVRTYDSTVTNDPNNFNVNGKIYDTDVLSASAYVEYLQGYAKGIFGGHFGTYDYSKPEYTRDETHRKPYLDNAFVNFRPTSNSILKNPDKSNIINTVYGGSQGQPGDFDSNKMQNRSYVLIDIPQDMVNFRDMTVYGAGAWGGLGMGVTSTAYAADKDKGSAIIDLVRGNIGAVYGASYKEGFTRRTVVNVPEDSEINVSCIFGGGYGEKASVACDVYEANVNYHSRKATVLEKPQKDAEGKTIEANLMTGAIYGGNNSYRGTYYSKVNISAPVYNGRVAEDGTKRTGTVYGAGNGANTWSQYTQVNLYGNLDANGDPIENEPGAEVYEVYGGGNAGEVLNKKTLAKREADHASGNTAGNPVWEFANLVTLGLETVGADLSEGTPTESNALYDDYYDSNTQTSKYPKCNTNVHIHKGAVVNMYLDKDKNGNPRYDGGYAYGAGKGATASVSGSTYIGLLGGTVKKDLYAGGSSGAVYDVEGLKTFTASTHAYIRGGSTRNVYGGSYEGSIGKHTGDNEILYAGTENQLIRFNPLAGSTADDIPGVAHVVIGIREDQLPANFPSDVTVDANNKPDLNFYKGVPSVQRNAYSGGEGGAVYGTANLLINNGYIGYYYDTADGQYKEKIEDETWFGEGKETRLEDLGSAYGGGYDDLSSVDYTNVIMYGGVIRNSLYGGGEIATIGRGSTMEETGKVRDLFEIYLPGKTHVEMYNGHVLRDVFGGGKGYNKLKYGVGHELYTDGYVFGQTEVYIHGGEIGTPEGVAKEYGNVFGAGNIGYVYSSGYKYSKTRNEGTGSPKHIKYYDKDENNNYVPTEDCKVVISPYLQISPNVVGGKISFKDKDYYPYDYIPTDYLNKLGKKIKTESENGKTVKTWPAEWNNLITAIDENTDRGIVIHNAVFGGGNVSTNSDKTYANATTVFGNVTATLYDAYHRDFISVETEHVGGLYGGGNFSMVDGYRELNITNYGTDYFSLDQKIDLEEYRTLSNRERAYFKLKYQCIKDVPSGLLGTKDYKTTDQPIDEDDYLKLVSKYGDVCDLSEYFETYGLCSIYAGRLLNTIQRADLCGVFGSRMVLQGAKDRVADTDQNVDFTINRVGEVSLNKKKSVISADTGDDAEHGNYFGIYSVVNFMGNLTSDQHFYDDYVAPDKHVDNSQTYYGYKSENNSSANRNKGRSPHQVALASGVHLELINESENVETKKYGYITGVVELDLINVKKDKVMGGGFVYAKNEHRVPKYYPNKTNVLLSEYNKLLGSDGKRDEAITYKRYRFSDADPGEWVEDGDVKVISGVASDYGGAEKVWQTSGNFIHHEKPIVDDCYPINNAYKRNDTPHSEAHYWYVKGEVYVYDQIVRAYTGSAAAYDKEALLNLTITAASNGKLQLLNVKPNLYAYYTHNSTGTVGKIGDTYETSDTEHENPIDKVTVNNEHDTYKLNDVITWWDWHQLPEEERAYFVTETYTNCVDCIIDNKSYAAGTYVMDQTAYNTFVGGTHVICNASGEAFEDGFKVFRSSNNISHDNGYVLTFEMSTPEVWSNYYTTIKRNGTEETDGFDGMKTIKASEYEALSEANQAKYIEAPTFYPVTTAVYGKKEYSFGDIVTKSTYDAYAHYAPTEVVNKLERAYVPLNTVTYTYKYYTDDTNTVYDTKTATANPGTAVPYNEIMSVIPEGDKSTYFAPAKVCINTVKLTEGVYLGYGDLKTDAEIADLIAQYAVDELGNHDSEKALAKRREIEDAMKDAYFCYNAGTFGGQELSSTQNYSTIEAWCGLPYSDRITGDTVDPLTGNKTSNFKFNGDALDLLGNQKYLEISTGNTGTGHIFPDTGDTQAAFGTTYSQQVPINYQAIKGEQTISRTEYEGLRNDQRHYTHVEVTTDNEEVYIAIDNFTYNGVPYGKGQIVDEDIWNANQTKVDKRVFTTAGDWYYRYETYPEDPYTSNADGGKVISVTEYLDETKLINEQAGWIIQGEEPKETTMFYVSCESDIYDVSKEKIITVVYQYNYYENEGEHDIKQVNELHVINIHLQLESGVPTIGPLTPPSIVIPGEAVNMSVPDVTIGSYPPLGNGWEIYKGEYDAKMHRNGVEYNNGLDPLYWYQNGEYYINYYSRNYLGKMYAPNPVPLKVANYHDLDAVMNDPEHHMFVDHPDVERASKIYIDNRTCQSDPDKNELDLLKDFFDLSVVKNPTLTDGLITGNDNTALNGHAPLDDHVHGARNLEFILQSDMSPKTYTTWSSIGSNNIIDNPKTTDVDEAIPDGKCFEGILHGDGHTISGLTSSLFNNLCGEVYNLGVTGSFTGAGIAETGDGYVENCWIRTTETPAKVTNENHFAVFGNPIRANNASDDPKGRGPVQVENCYYPESDDYQTPPASDDEYKHGRPTQMEDKAFYNGKVAYNLNGFYLKKRYYQGTNLASGTKYKYWPLNNGTLANKVTQGYYPDAYALYQPKIKRADGDPAPPHMGYVENRYYDGDFVYAGGRTPSGQNERFYSFTPDPNATEPQEEEDKGHYYPIWPDDYIFFGQALNYDHVEGLTHQDEPSAIYRDGGRVLMSEEGNRVYRAPAYFGNSTMRVAHFNPNAIFAATKKDDASVEAYIGMTAIDFSGYNDVFDATTTLPYLYGQQTRGFFPPLLDDDGITDFTNVDLTRNLLVYTSSNAASATTEELIMGKLTDEAFVDLRPSDYHTVEEASNLRQSQTIRGHWVKHLSGDDYEATLDHFLVDKEEFNAPIPYTFHSTTSGGVTTGNRMWYQRIPDNYVGKKKEDGTYIPNGAGWEGISLPFKAEIVTTKTKGEITHFYNYINATTNEDHRKGHEYWLRQYKGKKEGTDVTDGIFTANFQKPENSTEDGTKEYKNTFLWDYYYSNNSFEDLNSDKYPGTYYNTGHDYSNYPRLANGTPYIIGFPGERYYEFDLSGNFEAKTAMTTAPAKLEAQVITFASAPGASIAVSETELKAGWTAASADGYTFVPNYGKQTLGSTAYILNERKTEESTVIEAGSRYDVTAATSPATTLEVVPFRPYFMATAAVPAAREKTRSIIFSDEDSQLEGDDDHNIRDKEFGSLSIYAKRKKIVVESKLHETAEVRIVNTAGITVTTFDIEPGETIETRITNSAVYIVQTTDGRYNKKLVVK